MNNVKFALLFIFWSAFPLISPDRTLMLQIWLQMLQIRLQMFQMSLSSTDNITPR